MTDNNIQHLQDLLQNFRTAMLITHHAGGDVRARPMTLAEVDMGAELWFATSLSSAKVDEIERNSSVLVTLQDSTRYVSVAGRCELTRDRDMIEKLWSDAWLIWYPKGKNDPDLVLLRIVPERGEYWDMSGTTGVRFLWEAATSFFRGEKVQPVEGAHGVVHPEM